MVALTWTVTLVVTKIHQPAIEFSNKFGGYRRKFGKKVIPSVHTRQKFVLTIYLFKSSPSYNE